MERSEILMLVAIFLAVFLASFLFIAWQNSQNSKLYNFKIMTEDPVASVLSINSGPITQVKSVLFQNKSLILRQQLVNGSSADNSAVAAASAELVFAAYSSGIVIHNYGAIGLTPISATCHANNSNCGVPQITISVDSSDNACNCIKVFSNRTMLITGSSSFLFNNSVNLRQLVYAAKAA